MGLKRAKRGRFAYFALKLTLMERLPGMGNVAAADGPGDAQKQKGYIWDAALRAGLSQRTGTDLRKDRNRLLRKLAAVDLTGANPTNGSK